MALLGINTGTTGNDGTGDPIRVAMGKINSNFAEIYNTIGNGTSLSSYVSSAGIATLARNLIGSPIINVSGVFNTGITTTEHLEVRNITSIGIITAVQFVGDGSQLSNVTATFPGLDVLDDDVRRGVARELNFGDRIITTGPNQVGRVTISVDNSLALYANVAGVATVSLRSLSGYANTSGVSSSLYTSSGILTIGIGTVNYELDDDGVLTSLSKGLDIRSLDSNGLNSSQLILPAKAGENIIIEKTDGEITLFTSNTGTGLVNGWTFRLDGGVRFPDGIVQYTGFDGYADVSGISSTSENLVSNANINIGVVTATRFFGDGSGLTGVVATGSGIQIRDDGVLVGTAATVDFGQRLSVTIGSGIATISTPDSISYSLVSGVSTVATSAITAGYATTAGISTTSRGLTGSPNITVGIVTSSLMIPDRLYSKVQTINTSSQTLNLGATNAITGRFIVITATQNCIVTLPQPTAGNAGWEIIIKNRSLTSQLFLREFNGVDILTINPDQIFMLINDGIEWSVL